MDCRDKQPYNYHNTRHNCTDIVDMNHLNRGFVPNSLVTLRGDNEEPCILIYSKQSITWWWNIIISLLLLLLLSKRLSILWLTILWLTILRLTILLSTMLRLHLHLHGLLIHNFNYYFILN